MGAYKYYNPSTSKWEIIKSKSIIKPDGSLEYTPDDIKSIDDKVSGLESSFNVHQADLASQDVGKGADLVGLPDIDNNFTATTVGGAMQELFTNVSNGKSLVGGAITDVDENVVIPTDPTFQNLADAIGSISTGKKWATGISPAQSSIIVTGLDFLPTFIIIHPNDSDSYLNKYNVYDARISQTKFLKVASSSVVQETLVSSGGGYVQHGGFKLNLSYTMQWNWIAFE